MRTLSFHKSILAWFLLACLILGLVTYSGYRSFQQLNSDKNWVDHSYLVIEDLNTVLSNLRKAESAQRGYVLTGQQDYLEPYNTTLPLIDSGFEEIRKQVSDNEIQTRRLVRIQVLVTDRIRITKDVIAAFDAKGLGAAADIIRLGVGKKDMDEAATLIEDMITEEQRLLATRKQNAQKTSLTTLQISGAGVLICVLILMLVFWTVYKESKKREQTEESLQGALDTMEEANYQTSLLSKLSDYMQSSHDIDEAFRVIGNSLPQLLVGTSGSVGVFRNSRNLIEIMSKWGDADATAKDFNPDQCWGLRRGRAHYFVQGGTEPCCEHFTTPPQTASLCLPMQAQGETLGLFSVETPDIGQTSKSNIAFCRRVSEQISLSIANLNLQNKLREQSIRDPLTRLFNRRYLETTLERELKRAERNSDPLSILVLDIDYFKKFNDTMGHDAGDALLAQFGALLEQSVRKEDIVCRYGGEEFVIVLPNASLEMGVMRANKICEATRNMKLRFTNDAIKSVSVSIGVSAFPGHGGNGHDLISVADSALYLSKHNGRDRVTAAPPIAGTANAG